MTNPNTNKSTGNKYLDYLRGNLKTKLVDFPIWDQQGKPLVGQVLLKELSTAEHERIQKAACEECDYSFQNEAKIFTENSFILIQREIDRRGNITARHFISACCYDPEEPNKKVFVVPAEAGSLNNDQLDWLYKEYQSLLVGKPYLSMMNEQDLEETLESLATSATENVESFLSRLPLAEKNRLLVYSANLFLKSKNDSFLPSLLQSESNKDTPTQSPLPNQPAPKKP